MVGHLISRSRTFNWHVLKEYRAWLNFSRRCVPGIAWDDSLGKKFIIYIDESAHHPIINPPFDKDGGKSFLSSPKHQLWPSDCCIWAVMASGYDLSWCSPHLCPPMMPLLLTKCQVRWVDSADIAGSKTSLCDDPRPPCKQAVSALAESTEQ